MFSGIIKEIGVVRSLNKGILSISAPITGENAYIGQSIAVNGLCLTVRKINYRELFFDFTPETYLASALRYLKIGEKVNIEPAISANSDISGHFVLGHIDGIGKIILKKPVNNSFVIGIKIFNTVQDDIKNYLIKKGSIAIDGISLTISEFKNDVFFVSIIPLTYNETNLSFKRVGEYVNLESDILEKTIVKRIDDIIRSEGKKNGTERPLNPGKGIKSGLTYEFLSENGYL
ncbi:MAG: riboflavin synthase [Deltaproteobacteria bacterium]|jgi:riboflavin synthase|nr:riboflavin synthase [Deltaproteobacteria bacterium]MCL5880474.1 riboflavin synthase [Deltaproteobacteria bacterium]MDA8304655.1 riboflavin synthase [Deltaproteobacteria bacterium]